MLNAQDYTLLVVEDDWMLRNLMAMDLRHQGYKVHTAECGNQALEVLNKNKIDLIVSDVRMPNGDGLSLLDQIRAKDPQHPGLLFVTGHSEVSDRECCARGALQVLAKPFERQALRDTVNYWVETLAEKRPRATKLPAVIANANLPSRGSLSS
ncbi:MAG: response regulator [Bdellovibrionaceae bacterium]|nr:response regulator [Pseudobdellovibrionaceae bacterium]MBX3034284.1 response regulator [Pseudobdellovibrionaceae bacterium]